MTLLNIIIPASRAEANFLTWLPWALFGNDEDGVAGERSGVPGYTNQPSFGQFIRWWFRNPFHNVLFHVLRWKGGPFFQWGTPGSGFNGYIGFRTFRNTDGVFGIAVRFGRSR